MKLKKLNLKKIKMKIKNRDVKSCENKDGSFTSVLDIEYTHKWESGRILIKDYNPELEEEYMKELRIKVRNHYNEQKLKA